MPSDLICDDESRCDGNRICNVGCCSSGCSSPSDSILTGPLPVCGDLVVCSSRAIFAERARPSAATDEFGGDCSCVCGREAAPCRGGDDRGEVCREPLLLPLALRLCDEIGRAHV